ncbi:MAG TPA: hypothetical protein DGG95_08110 [Cytophagales bacterium]|jgi:hypothetical protein|nr:hypothetical protein [Cytophagales bacterium]
MKLLLSTIRKKWPEYILEVIVLIIGIYGAFALERWNENKNTKAFEHSTLQQILVNLKSDRDNLIAIQTHNLRAIYSTKRILALDQSTPEMDSLKFWLGDVAQFDRFQPLTNAYEVLKARGLDVLTNQELAYQIGKYYDDDAQKIVKTIGDIELAFNTEWEPLLRNYGVDFQWKKLVILSDWNLLFNNGTARKIIILNKDNYSSGTESLIKVLNSLDALITAVEFELKEE